MGPRTLSACFDLFDANLDISFRNLTHTFIFKESLCTCSVRSINGRVLAFVIQYRANQKVMVQPSSCYQPLRISSTSIRLLVLCPEPHPEDHRIQCKLVIEDLESSPHYEALSYTWGVPDDLNFKIWVNGVHLPVRRNLLTVLRALRRDKDRTLWIDALCINQEDVRERQQQVGIMGSIYMKAARVVGWLGMAGHT